jgi:DNA-binding CsgD family transcriptional regulator
VPLPPADAKRVLRAIASSPSRAPTAEGRLRAPHLRAALVAAFEAIGGPALLVSATGKVLLANDAGRAALARDRRTLTQAIAAAIAHRPPTLPVALTPLDGTGLGYVVVVRGKGHVADRLRAASARWKLTPRETEVLEHLAGGATNRTIADALRIVERTVEFHIASIFDKVGVESRAALVARLLAGP